MASVLVAMGGNVGDVRTTLQQSIGDICKLGRATLIARSSDYRTPPWGHLTQDPFINACIEIETPLDPHALLSILQQVEAKYGRDRAQEFRWGPRTLDLDIIAYDDLKFNSDVLTLPHPRTMDRAFVLVPLVEIAPDRAIDGTSPRRALTALSSNGIERL